ncbi:hypothetical protein [Vibrio metoecus]|uniref:hypothetical protein n=1 Tax=Vibrio metoecus TaxID=1481663 RepID=UPI00272D0EC9|nr:hypothetical protein [Vibrio metoecus]WKY93735.1 hypothetical protein QYQ96_03345 [Vibrio metoecus]
MQLVKLVVRSPLKIIRECTFNSGLNIITNKGEHGNQVGKSTVLRIINFCLGSDGTSIWHDPESKQINEGVYNFIVGGGVYFDLFVKMSSNDKNPVLITRTIEKPKSRLKRLSWINGIEYKSQDAFELALQALLKVSYAKPNYKTLKNRLFRVRKEVANAPLKYDNIFTSEADYRVIYSYLFGFSAHDQVKEEYNLNLDLKQIEAREKSLKNGKDISEYHLEIERIKSNINKLRSMENEFDFSGVHLEKLKDLNNVRSYISSSSSNIYKLNTQLDFSHRTIEQYENKKAEIDIKLLSSIYSEANSLIPNLSKSFSDVVDFHNKMLENKITFTKNQVNKLLDKIDTESKNLDTYLNKEKLILKNLINEQHLAGFFMIEDEIQKESVELGKCQYVVDEIDSMKIEKHKIDKKLETIKSKIKSEKLELENNINLFNDCFEPLNKKLFDVDGVKFSANFDDTESLNFRIINQSKILGDGAPRALSMATDLAFVVYAKNKGLKLPYLTLQDYLDAIDEDKLAILSEWADKNGIQVILSVLNDKLSRVPEPLKTNSIKFELSKDDKFFRL